MISVSPSLTDQPDTKAASFSVPGFETQDLGQVLTHVNNLATPPASMHFSRNPWMFLNALVASPRPIRRPNLTTRESFLKSLNYHYDHGGRDFKNLKCPNRKLNQWLLTARRPTSDWLHKIEFLHETRNLHASDFYKTYLN